MKKKDLKNLLRTEAAEELGLMDKVRKTGWGGLTSRETGRMGAVIKSIKHKSGKSGGEGAP